MTTADGHDFVRVDETAGVFSLLCGCGWRTPAAEHAQRVGESWDEHRVDEREEAM